MGRPGTPLGLFSTDRRGGRRHGRDLRSADGGQARVLGRERPRTARRRLHEPALAADDGEIGNGAAGGDVTTPTSVVDLGPTNADVPVSARPVVTSVSASRRNTCVVLTDTVVRCWGGNSTDQLGDGIGPFSLSPRTVALAGGL